MTACLPATVTFGMTACFQTSLEQAAVLVTQQNAFLMPKGSVIVCLGWRSPFSRHSITYFDSHILRSLDHARALYYPSYSAHELSSPAANSVTLDVEKKALPLINEALRVYQTGFPIPLPLETNANRLDTAFERLVQASDGLALQARTEDYAWGSEHIPPACRSHNGVEFLVFGPTVAKCPWHRHLPGLIQDFDL